MKKFIKKHWGLILVILLAAFLRLYHLGVIPSSLTWDETALGYNAYSILKTGKDEYGNFLPLIFKSFGDFKPGFYIYLTVPSVAIFGLTELAVRLPSAIFGVATVFLIYLLINRLFKSNKFGIWAALVLALSPWHIQFSRGAWEANIAVFLMVAGVFTFIKALEDNRFLPPTSIFFGLSFFTYQGAKVFTPLLLLGLMMIFWRKIKELPRKSIVVSVLVLIALVTPLFLGTVFNGGGGRARVMSIFSYPRPQEDIEKILTQDRLRQSSLIFNLFHNETLNFTRGILGRYFNHFSGKFLFFEGDWSNKRLGVPYSGVLYFIEMLFLFFGVYFVLGQKDNQAKKLLFYWLFVASIPAAITRDSVSAVRSLNMVVPLTIFVGAGVYQLVLFFHTKKTLLKLSVYGLLFVIYVWNVAYFLDQYFIHAPIHNASTSQYGYREVVQSIAPVVENYDKVVFTQVYGQPYIYWLFYTKYNPADYQKQSRLTENSVGDVGQVEHLDNIQFRNFHWLSDINVGDLFIGDETSLHQSDVDQVKGAKTLKDIYFPDGKLAFRVVERK